MASCNSVHLIGNLTKDPEVRRTPSGAAVCALRLAVNEKYKNKQGEAAETTCFVDVEAWDRQAEICEQYLAKGSSIYAEGKLHLDEWKTEEGQTRSRLKVRARRIQFLGRPKGQEGEGNGKRGSKAPPADAETDDDMPF